MYLYIYLYIRYSILFTDCLKRRKARGREIECKVSKKGKHFLEIDVFDCSLNFASALHLIYSPKAYLEISECKEDREGWRRGRVVI